MQEEGSRYGYSVAYWDMSHSLQTILNEYSFQRKYFGLNCGTSQLYSVASELKLKSTKQPKVLCKPSKTLSVAKFDQQTTNLQTVKGFVAFFPEKQYANQFLTETVFSFFYPKLYKASDIHTHTFFPQNITIIPHNAGTEQYLPPIHWVRPTWSSDAVQNPLSGVT